MKMLAALLSMALLGGCGGDSPARPTATPSAVKTSSPEELNANVAFSSGLRWLVYTANNMTYRVDLRAPTVLPVKVTDGYLMDVSADGQTVVVHRVGPDTVVIRPDGSELRLGFGGDPSLSPDGRWLVFNEDGKVLVNVATGEKQNVGKGQACNAHALCPTVWSPTSTYYALYEGTNATVKAPVTGATILANGFPQSWLSADVLLLSRPVANSYERDFIRYDVKAGREELLTRTAVPAKLSPDQKLVAITREEKETLVATLNGLPRFRVDGSAMAWSGDGNFISVSTRQCGSALIYDSTTGARARCFMGTIGLNGPAWAPSGATIAYARGTDVFIFDAVSGAERRIFHGNQALVSCYKWSADGATLMLGNFCTL